MDELLALCEPFAWPEGSGPASQARTSIVGCAQYRGSGIERAPACQGARRAWQRLSRRPPAHRFGQDETQLGERERVERWMADGGGGGDRPVLKSGWLLKAASGAHVRMTSGFDAPFMSRHAFCSSEVFAGTSHQK